MNKNKHLIAFSLLALFSLLISSCDLKGGSDYKSFDYNLQGTWETNEGNNYDYSGTLVIDYNTITISGYASNSGYEFINGDSRRPFKDFTKNAPLEGYSEEGKIFIKDAGIIQKGLPYTYWEVYSRPEQKQIQFLRFNFNGRDETLRKQ